MRRAVEWLWFDRSFAAATARLLLAPWSVLFGAVVRRRNARFDAMVAPAALPALSIGNLTVGGTGKTPVASWFARRLAERGAHPAIVLRGYGDDEWRVHRLLTPHVPVVVNADRRAAMQVARADGADCAVLDDAFQHRQAGRVSDVVLISADRHDDRVRVLPTGPFREGYDAVRRATAVVVTVKSAEEGVVSAVIARVRQAAPDIPLAVVRLSPDAIHRADRDEADGGAERGPAAGEGEGMRHPLSWLAGRRLLATTAIADPAAFERQLVARGARLVGHRRFPDHHDFRAADVAWLVREAQGTDGVVCTLKDAVKLASRWPRAAVPLWYVSQTLVVDRGAEVLERECDRVLAAREAAVLRSG